MRDLIRPPRLLIALLTVLGAVGVVAPAAAAPAAVQATGAGSQLVLRSDAGASSGRLSLPSGEELALPLPPGAEVTTLAGPAHAWAAVGTTAERGRTGLIAFTGDERQVRRFPQPPSPAARMRTQPVPLMGELGLAGLAWLEGDQRGALGVRAAAWDGGAWSPTQLVSPPGQGSQLALSGAALADGSWLLVWAAFDGNDDEILWSRYRDGQWSAPRRVAADNGVPDITPALVATAGGGALVAWSRYDGGDYRLVATRFDGHRWSAVETVGPAGSLYPSFAAAGGGTYLLYRTALPRGWQVVEVDRAGQRGRVAAVTVEGSERPLVLPAAGGGVRLVFPATGEDATVRWRADR